MLQSNLCDYSDPYIIAKGTINVTDPNNDVYDNIWLLKIMHHSLAAFQKLIIPLLIMQKTQTL